MKTMFRVVAGVSLPNIDSFEANRSSVKLRGQIVELEHRTGFEPVSQRRQRRVLNQLDQRC